eukprot:153988-Chlamydomonas_euryale.AAC.1
MGVAGREGGRCGAMHTGWRAAGCAAKSVDPILSGRRHATHGHAHLEAPRCPSPAFFPSCFSSLLGG